MFNERMALKTRLEELDAREVRVAKECREERERIYERLRKLDEQEQYFPLNSPTENESEVVSKEQGIFISNEEIPLLVKELGAEVIEIASKTLNTHLKEQVEPVIQSLKESSSMLKQSHELSGVNSEKEKRNKKEEDKNSRRARVNTKPLKESADYSVLEETALSILKQHTASVQSSELKKDVEARTGMKIQNMTLFMQRLMKHDPQIEKPFRGQYIYKNENEDKELTLEQKGDGTPEGNTNHELQGNESVLNQDLEKIE